jgi:hypothetical protein
MQNWNSSEWKILFWLQGWAIVNVKIMNTLHLKEQKKLFNCAEYVVVSADALLTIFAFILDPVPPASNTNPTSLMSGVLYSSEAAVAFTLPAVREIQYPSDEGLRTKALERKGNQVHHNANDRRNNESLIV